MVKENKSKAWKVLALFLTSILILQTCLFGLSAPVYAADGSDDLDIDGVVDIFKAEYTKDGHVIIKSQDGSKVVAPGAENTQEFQVINRSGKSLTYTFKASLEFKSESGDTKVQDLPMQYKMTKDGVYILGDRDTWVNSENFKVDRDDFFVKAGGSSFFNIIWQWPFEVSPEQDILDTNLGNDFDAEGADQVVLHFTAVGSDVPEPDPAIVTGKTASTITIIPEADQEYSISKTEEANETWIRPTQEQLEDGHMSFLGLDKFTEYTIHNRYYVGGTSRAAERNATTRAVDAREIGEAFAYYDGSTTTDGKDLQEVADNGNSHIYVDRDGNYAGKLINTLTKTVTIPGNWEKTSIYMDKHDIQGQNGKSGTDGEDGEIALQIVKADLAGHLGSQLYFNGPGNILGGDGGDGTRNGGNGAIGVKVDSGSNSTFNTGTGLKVYGGDGGNAINGTGGTGGTGVEGRMEVNKGDIYGGDGGNSEKGNGGNGGTGVEGDINENDGNILGGDGGDSIDGDGGNGGAGVIGDIDVNKGEIYGGDGGDSENGHAGKGGDGIIGHIGQNDGVIEAGEGGIDNQGGGERGKDINTGDATTIMLFAIPLFVLLAGLTIYLIMRKRRNEK